MQSSDNGHSRIEGITKQKVPWQSLISYAYIMNSSLPTNEIEKTLLQAPDMGQGSIKLPESDHDTDTLVSCCSDEIEKYLHVHVRR